MWDESNPKRIKSLHLEVQSLSGRLDVSGLTNLIALYCESNNLETLDGLGSLTKLDILKCSWNNLETLDGLGSLARDLAAQAPETGRAAA